MWCYFKEPARKSIKILHAKFYLSMFWANCVADLHTYTNCQTSEDLPISFFPPCLNMELTWIVRPNWPDDWFSTKISILQPIVRHWKISHFLSSSLVWIENSPGLFYLTDLLTDFLLKYIYFYQLSDFGRFYNFFLFIVILFFRLELLFYQCISTL